MNPLFLYLILAVINLGTNSCEQSACNYQQQFINVTDHGVIPDDSMDDTDAIRNVFLHVVQPNQGATVFFPKGVYLIDPSHTNSMEVVGNCTKVTGVKGHTIIKLMDNSIDGSIPTDDGFVVQRLLEGVMLGNKGRKNNTGNHDIIISNIIFDGNCRNNPLQDDNGYPSVNHAVHFWSVENLVLEHCEIINTCHAGFVLVQCTNSLIHKNYFFDIGQGKRNADPIQVNGSRITTIRENVLENTGEGIFCQHHSSTNTSDMNCNIVNNIIRIVDYNGKCLGDKYPYECCTGFMEGSSTGQCRRGKARGSSIGLLSQNSTAKGNYIDGHAPMTVHAQQRHADVETKNIKVHDNTFVDIAKFNPFSGGAIWLVADSNNVLSNVEVFDNTIVDSYTSGIALQYSDKGNYSGHIKNIKITNNQIFGACLNPSARAGISFANNAFTYDTDRFINVEVNGNLFSNINRYAIWIDQGAKQIRFTKNCFENYKLFLLNLQCIPDSNCTKDVIDVYSNNSPMSKKELERLEMIMNPNGSLYNYCYNCDLGSDCPDGTGAYAVMQGGGFTCQ